MRAQRGDLFRHNIVSVTAFFLMGGGRKRKKRRAGRHRLWNEIELKILRQMFQAWNEMGGMRVAPHDDLSLLRLAMLITAIKSRAQVIGVQEAACRPCG